MTTNEERSLQPGQQSWASVMPRFMSQAQPMPRMPRPIENPWAALPRFMDSSQLPSASSMQANPSESRPYATAPKPTLRHLPDFPDNLGFPVFSDFPAH